MSGSFVRVEPVDQLVLDGESIVLHADRYVRLGPIGTHLMVDAGTPRTIEDLAATLTAAFGEPAEGSAVDATRAAVASLVEQGVMREADGD